MVVGVVTSVVAGGAVAAGAGDADGWATVERAAQPVTAAAANANTVTIRTGRIATSPSRSTTRRVEVFSVAEAGHSTATAKHRRHGESDSTRSRSSIGASAPGHAGGVSATVEGRLPANFLDPVGGARSLRALHAGADLAGTIAWGAISEGGCGDGGDGSAGRPAAGAGPADHLGDLPGGDDRRRRGAGRPGAAVGPAGAGAGRGVPGAEAQAELRRRDRLAGVGPPVRRAAPGRAAPVP